MTTQTVRFTVDRRDSKFLVLLDEQGASLDVPADAIPPDCRRAGTVLDAPVASNGHPQWKYAKRNRGEEERRVHEATAALERLRRPTE